MKLDVVPPSDCNDYQLSVRTAAGPVVGKLKVGGGFARVRGIDVEGVGEFV